MFFYMLPLLLLITSVICASPIHLERRLTVCGAYLPDHFEDKRLCRDWYRYLRNSDKKIEGVDGAMKAPIENHGQDPLIAVKIEVMCRNVPTVMKTIDKLEETLDKAGECIVISWRWQKMDMPGRFAFRIFMAPEGEEIVKEELGHLRKIKTGRRLRQGIRGSKASIKSETEPKAEPTEEATVSEPSTLIKQEPKIKQEPP